MKNKWYIGLFLGINLMGALFWGLFYLASSLVVPLLTLEYSPISAYYHVVKAEHGRAATEFTVADIIEMQRRWESYLKQGEKSHREYRLVIDEETNRLHLLEMTCKWEYSPHVALPCRVHTDSSVEKEFRNIMTRHGADN